MGKIYPLRELILYVRENSLFYKDLYQDIDLGDESLELRQLPIVSQESFWKANALSHNTLLTGPMDSGLVFKSGGTTGNPKFSIYTQEEWETFTEEFGLGIIQAGLQKGDKVANLFYAGGLYASFVFIMKSLEKASLPILQLPLSGQTDLEEMVKILGEFHVDVLAGVPTTILSLLEKLLQKEVRPPLKKIFFGGECLYPDQRAWIEKSFPDIKISSIGHASVDGGHLGFASSTTQYNEHHVFSKSTIMEIVDEETLEPVLEPHIAGKLIYTNLTRTLMPIIRYPVGDRGMWIDPPGAEFRKYKILGRSEEGARVGTVTLNREDILSILESFKDEIRIVHVQFKLTRLDHKDLLTLRLALDSHSLPNKMNSEWHKKIINEIYLRRPHLADEVAQKRIHPFQLELVDPSHLETNSRTGKMKTVIDLRT